MANTIDPAELSIAAALFSSVAEEMGVTLGRTAHSPNINLVPFVLSSSKDYLTSEASPIHA